MRGLPPSIRQRPESSSRGSCCRRHVQHHFGADVLERFHLEVRRSHPRLYRAERMLDPSGVADASFPDAHRAGAAPLRECAHARIG